MSPTIKMLAAGPYVLRIVKAYLDATIYGNLSLKIVYDVAEGEQKGMFADLIGYDDSNWRHEFEIDIQANNGALLNDFIAAVEKSNDGYKWDWNVPNNLDTLDDKLVGCIFQDRLTIVKRGARKGQTSRYLDLWDTVPADSIRSGEASYVPPVNDMRFVHETQYQKDAQVGASNQLKPIETVYNGYRFRSRLEARWAVFFDALGVKYEYEPEGFELPSGDYYLPDFRVKCYGTLGAYKVPETIDRDDLCGCCRYSHSDPYGLGDTYAYEGDCTNPNIEWEYDGTDRVCVAGVKTCSSTNNSCVECDHFELDTGNPFDLYIEVKGRMTQSDWDKIEEFSGLSSLPSEQAELGNNLANPILVVGSVPRDFGEMQILSYKSMDGIDCYQFNHRTINGYFFGAYPTADDGYFYLMGDGSDYMSRIGIEKTNSALLAARQARFEHGETPKAQRIKAKPKPCVSYYPASMPGV